MHNYEILLIIHPDLDETAVNGVIEKTKGWITEAGGTVEGVDVWGRRKMAFLIRKQREGHYVLIKAQMLPASTAELERNLRFLEPVLRFLVTVQE
jgi:small subunit ribosomal protein S6